MGKSHQPKMHITYVCMNCGKEYHPKELDRNKFCSRECAFEFKKAKPKEPKIITCAICCKAFRGRGKYCSDECRKEKARIAHNEGYKSVKESNPFIEKKCAYCGVLFKTNYYANVKDFCSKNCERKYFREQYKETRRTQMEEAFIENVYFERLFKHDNGVCQICGQPVKHDKEPSDPMAATIDHIIPLSRGGKHHPGNCQLAHRICNSLKSNKLPGEM